MSRAVDTDSPSVTFICNKTDDISLIEASDSLGLDEQNGPLWKQLDQHEAKQASFKKDLKNLVDTKAIYGEIMGDCDDQQEIWEDLMSQIDEGKTVYPPTEGKKRKRSGNSEQREKQKRSNDDDEDESDKDEADGDDDLPAEHNESLTKAFVSAKLADIKATKKEARQSRLSIDEQAKAMRKEIVSLKDAAEEIEAEISRVCIEGRNAYSKGAIQQDFAGK